MELFKKIARLFTKQSPLKDPVHDSDILFPALISAKQFAAMKPGQRMQAVMITGDEGRLQYFGFMKWCIEHDPDTGVRFAALKRLHHFAGHTDLHAFLLQLDQSAGRLQLEPYLSMALARTGVISNEELNTRLNGG